jgi:hypothetical protein
MQLSRRTLMAVGIASILAAEAARAAEIGWIDVDKRLLRERVTVAEAEAKYMYNGVPFGFLNDKWRALLAEMQDGDETVGVRWLASHGHRAGPSWRAGARPPDVGVSWLSAQQNPCGVAVSRQLQFRQT